MWDTFPMVWEQLTDSYNRTARLTPALLVTLPLNVLVITFSIDSLSWWGKSLTLLVASGLPFAITQVVRDRGRHIEPELFSSWGGAPTTVMLRWSGQEARVAVSRRHDLLSRLIDVRLPTEEEEQVNPREADALYAIATTALRELTRDGSRFALLQHELAAYGFWRNAFGCRGLGVATSIVATGGVLLSFWSGLVSLDRKQLAGLVAFNCLWGLGWWRICTRNWVRWAGESYARQLFASLEVLIE